MAVAFTAKGTGSAQGNPATPSISGVSTGGNSWVLVTVHWGTSGSSPWMVAFYKEAMPDLVCTLTKR